MRELRLSLTSHQRTPANTCEHPIGGEGGIRTHGTVTRTTVFETVPFDHSGTSPKASTCGIGGRERTFIVLVSWRQLEARPKQTATLRLTYRFRFI